MVMLSKRDRNGREQNSSIWSFSLVLGCCNCKITSNDEDFPENKLMQRLRLLLQGIGNMSDRRERWRCDQKCKIDHQSHTVLSIRLYAMGGHVFFRIVRIAADVSFIKCWKIAIKEKCIFLLIALIIYELLMFANHFLMKQHSTLSSLILINNVIFIHFFRNNIWME